MVDLRTLTAYSADDDNLVSDGSGAVVSSSGNTNRCMCAALEPDNILKDLRRTMKIDGADNAWCQWVFTTRAWTLMSGSATPETLREVEDRTEKIELARMNDSLIENSRQLDYALIMLLRSPALT